MPEEISQEELERRERAMRVLVENYPQAAAGNRAAWLKILAAQDREPTQEEEDAFRRSEGLSVLQVAREVEMSGMPVPAGFAEKVRKASAAFDAGLGGDLRAWQRALGLVSGAKMSTDDIRRFEIVGGPPPLEIERQFALTGEDSVRPQGHLDQLKKLDRMYRAGLRGAPDAVRWLEAAFGHPPNSLTSKDLLGPDGSRLSFGGMTDGLRAGPSGFLAGLAGLTGAGDPGDPMRDGMGRRGPGRGSGGVEDGPGDVDQQPGQNAEPGGWDSFAFEDMWPPAGPTGGEDPTNTGGGGQEEPEPVWMQAADALRGPVGDDGSGISGPRGSSDAAPPSSPDMDSFGQRDTRGSRSGGGGSSSNAEVEEGDGFTVESPATVLGYPVLDLDEDGNAEVHDPNTLKVVGEWTPPNDSQADTNEDGQDDSTDGEEDGEEDNGEEDGGDDTTPTDTDPSADEADEDGTEKDSMPNPVDDGVTVTIDPAKIDLDRVIGGGDPVGPDGEDAPSRNATGPLVRRRNKGDVDPLPDADGVTVTIDPATIDLDRVIGGGDPVGPDVDGGDGGGPGRPGSKDGLGPLVPDGIDPKARIGRRPR